MPLCEASDSLVLANTLQGWRVPPLRERLSPKQLSSLFPSTLCTLTSTIQTQTPHSRPSPGSKPWSTPILTILPKEFTKATQRAERLHTLNLHTAAKQSRLGQFKATRRAKASYWAHFRTKTTSHNIWTPKQFVARRETPRFPSLPGATDPVSINRALLDHCSRTKDPLPLRGSLSRDPEHPPSQRNKLIMPWASYHPPPPPELTPSHIRYGTR